MNALAQRVREGRNSGAVLKVKLSNVRSRHPDAVILVFEGPEDVGPYGVWISRIDDSFRYEPLPGSGKDQVLDLRLRLRDDKVGLAAGVYFLVDRDFDDLKGQAGGSDLFCTGTYSIENHLVTEAVVERLLVDEFRCIGDNDDRAGVLATFRETFSQFLTCMNGANKRLFRSRRLGIRVTHKEESVPKYVAISLLAVSVAHSGDGLSDLIRLEREPTDEECAEIDVEFATLDPKTRHRGKFQLAFLLRWLDLLAAERKSLQHALFSKAQDVKFSAQQLTLGWLASRSQIPEGLALFVNGIAK